MDFIRIRGARTHNLRNIDIDIPRNKLIVITGLSGSGKSSLAFNTIYAEGQRRYVESLSAYARQFLSLMEKPEVDYIEGLSPAISIEQKATSHNPRSTVGTVTEIHDYLRLLYARVGEAKCPEHQILLSSKTVSEIIDSVLEIPENEKILIMSPIVQNRKGSHIKLIKELSNQGFLRARVNSQILFLEEIQDLDRNKFHTIEIIIDRLKIKKDISSRLAQSIETALNMSSGIVKIAPMEEGANWQEKTFSANLSCTECGYSLNELEPRLFSFNNPMGACENCSGLGVKDIFDEEKIVANPDMSLADGAIYGWSKNNIYYYQLLLTVAKHYGFSINKPFNELTKEQKNIILQGSGDEVIDFSKIRGRRYWSNNKTSFEGIIPTIMRLYKNSDISSVREDFSRYIVNKKCTYCNGDRINKSARNVFIADKNLPSISKMSIVEAFEFLTNINFKGKNIKIASKIVQEISNRLHFLMNVGLEYLSLDRSANTLSGGEAQRIRLASQIGAGLVGVLYVLDEPSIGLHQRDNKKLLKALIALRDLGNTVIIVEHDEEAIQEADYIIDIGIGAGVHGGNVVARGEIEDIINNKKSLTGDYLSGRKIIEVPSKRKKISHWAYVYGASGNNLKNVDLALPVGVITCVTGVSGSGKSTLINNTLYSLLAKEINKSYAEVSPYKGFKGIDIFDKVISINQSPIGRTPRSNPVTYTAIFGLIRDLFSQTTESRARGYKPGRFSFNVKGGRCEACKGDGLIKVEMHFLPDIYVPCDLCNGDRYNRETLEIKYKDKSISQILNMTVEESAEFFANIPKIKQKLQTLIDVGLSYITLGQNATTLSGGEAQRIKLAKELSKKDTSKTIYILDEPTTGLHFQDINQLLNVLKRLRDKNNTIVVIEHNLDVIKTADWIIDLGPEGGAQGGHIISQGTPEQICKAKNSITGQYLKKYIN